MSVWGARWGLTWGKSFGDVAPPAPPATGKFNALSLAKLGVGFGALAVASIGMRLGRDNVVLEVMSGGGIISRRPRRRRDEEDIIMVFMK